MRPSAALLAAVALSVGLAGCKGKKRELGLSRGRDGGPAVIVVDSPARASGVGPIAEESEPNDVRDDAGVVAVPGGIDGSLTSSEDIDFYRIEPAKEDRILVVELTGAGKKEGGADLMLDLYDGDGAELVRSDRGPAGVVEGAPNWHLPAGAAMYLSVSEFVRKGSKKRKSNKEGEQQGEPPPYRLTVQTALAGQTEEIEPNDEADDAREVLLADEVLGYLGWSKDVDLWKLSLAGFAGGYALDIHVEGIEGIEMTVEVLGSDASVIASRSGQKGRGVRVRGLSPEAGVSHWLAKLSGNRSHPQMPYRLVARSRSLEPGDEVEPNDDRDAATAVPDPPGDGAEGQLRGYVDGGDVDVYKLEGGREPLDLDVVLDPPPSVDVKLRLLDASGKELGVSEAGKVGQREEVRGIALASGATVYLEVSGSVQGDEVDPYQMRWTTRVDLAEPMEPAGDPDFDDDNLDDEDPALDEP